MEKKLNNDIMNNTMKNLLEYSIIINTSLDIKPAVGKKNQMKNLCRENSKK